MRRPARPSCRLPRGVAADLPAPEGAGAGREMTASWHTLLDVAIRTTIVYLALLVGLRLTGTRQLGQMSTFDLVLLLIIANAVQNAMVGPDTSPPARLVRSEEHTSELQSLAYLVCRLLLEKKKTK